MLWSNLNNPNPADKSQHASESEYLQQTKTLMDPQLAPRALNLFTRKPQNLPCSWEGVGADLRKGLTTGYRWLTSHSTSRFLVASGPPGYVTARPPHLWTTMLPVSGPFKSMLQKKVWIWMAGITVGLEAFFFTLRPLRLRPFANLSCGS